MSSAPRLSRRTLLRGLLGGAVVTVGLPPLEVFFNTSGNAYADGGALPGRFGLFFWGNGMLPDRWVPTGEGDGDAWSLSDQLKPLARHKDHITVVSGMRVMTGNEIPHTSGASGILSGAPLISNGDDHTFMLPSIDQVIAQAIGGATRFRSLEFGAKAREGLSFNGPNSLNPPESSPHKLYERVFGAGFRAPGEEEIVDPTIGLRRSVLDAIGDDARRLKRRLGANDRLRIDEHFEAIRELERRLARLEEDPPDLAACARPDAPKEDYPAREGRPQIRALNDAFADVCAMAMACDQTRVFSNFITTPVSNHLIADAPAGHHSLTHDEPGSQPEVHKIVVHIMEQCARFIDRLREVPEGDGTLLDNTLMYCTSEISMGRTHHLDEMPIVLAGGACGRIRTGHHYRSKGAESASKLLLTLARAMGVDKPDFGAEGGYVTDSLGAIET